MLKLWQLVLIPFLVSTTLTLAQTSDSSCGLPTRLTANWQARVLPGEPNWVHVDPARSAEKMGEIPAGETVIVRSRPQCDPVSGMNYYRIQYQNLNGWTSEGLGDEYWLEPIPGREFFLAETVDRLSTDALDEAIRLRHPNGVTVVITSENGERMATADLTGTIVVWNTLTGAEVAVMEHPGGVASMAFRPDGVVLVTGGSENNIRMWNILTVPTGEGTTIIRGGRVNGVAFNPLGRLLAGINPDGSVSVWDVTNSPAVLLVTLPSTGLLDTISFSADNTRLMAYGSQNVRIWSVQQQP